MSAINREKLIHEAETCRETTDAFVSLIQSQPNDAVKNALSQKGFQNESKS